MPENGTGADMFCHFPVNSDHEFRVNGGLLGVHVHDSIGGRAVLVRNRRHAFEIGGNLVIGAGKRREWDASPASGYRAVHVPQKQVPDICRLPEHGGERLCAVELDPVQARNSDIEGRVVHEQVDRVRFRVL